MLELIRRKSAAGEAPSPSDLESTAATATAAASTPRGGRCALGWWAWLGGGWFAHVAPRWLQATMPKAGCACLTNAPLQGRCRRRQLRRCMQPVPPAAAPHPRCCARVTAAAAMHGWGGRGQASSSRGSNSARSSRLEERRTRETTAAFTAATARWGLQVEGGCSVPPCCRQACCKEAGLAIPIWLAIPVRLCCVSDPCQQSCLFTCCFPTAPPIRSDCSPAARRAPATPAQAVHAAAASEAAMARSMQRQGRAAEQHPTPPARPSTPTAHAPTMTGSVLSSGSGSSTHPGKVQPTAPHLRRMRAPGR